MIKLLMTGGGGAGNEALWRLIGKKYELYFADADRAAINPQIPQDRRLEIPLANDKRFVSEVTALCKALAIDLLVPGVDEELAVLAAQADDLAPTKLLLPSHDYVATMLDKIKMVEALAARGIAVPLSEPLVGNLSRISFPCICKPRTGRGSRNVTVLQNESEARSMIASMGAAAQTMMVQERIEGTEYTIQMAADASGTLHAIVPVKVGIKRGITLRAATASEPNVIATCRAIHDAIPTAGCYNIQLMLTPDGRAVPFEINPRISTTLCLVVAAGVDPFSIYLGKTEAHNLMPFTPNVQLQRHWHNFIRERRPDEV